MSRLVRAILKAFGGLIGGAVLGIAFSVGVVIVFNVVSGLLSFISGASLPSIGPNEPLVGDALRIAGLLGAVIGTVWGFRNSYTAAA